MGVMRFRLAIIAAPGGGGAAAPAITGGVGYDSLRRSMATTRISRRHQVVIPQEIREGLSLRSGQYLHVIRKGNAIVLVPDRPISAFRGILRGMPTTGYREKDRF